MMMTDTEYRAARAWLKNRLAEHMETKGYIARMRADREYQAKVTEIATENRRRATQRDIAEAKLMEVTGLTAEELRLTLKS